MHTACHQIEAQPMCRATQQVTVKLTACQRRTVVGAGIVDRVDGAFDIEDDDAATLDENNLAFSGRQLIDRIDRNEV